MKKIAISADFLHETIDIAVWSVIEPGLGILAGCTATIRPLFKGMGFGSMVWPSANRYNKAGGGGTPKQFFLSVSRRPHATASASYARRAGGAAHSVGSHVSELELRQSHSEPPKSKGSTWNIEAGHREDNMDHSDGISIHTSFNVSTYRAGDGHDDELGRSSLGRVSSETEEV